MPTNSSSSPNQELTTTPEINPSAPLAKMDLEGGDSPWGGKSTAIMFSLIAEQKLTFADVPSSATKPTADTSGFGQSTGKTMQWHHLAYLISALDSKSKPEALNTSSAQALKSPAGRNPRTPRRPGTQPVRLEALDDSLGPLGPLGENAPVPQVDQPPAPPQKEQVVTHNIRQPLAASQSSISRSMLDSVDLSDDVEPAVGPRVPPPVQPAQGAPVRRDTQPSVSVEQAAKPNFYITVGDPHKVGDLTSSHIVYLVRTKVRFAHFESLDNR